MKKIMTLLGIATVGMVAAQKLGKVGINNTAPEATLDIQVRTANTDTNEGILIPRVSVNRVKAITAVNRVEGTLVYVTENVTDSESATFEGTGKGFYHYDSAKSKWVKLGSSEAKPEGTFTRNIRTYNTESVTVSDTDYMLVNLYLSDISRLVLPSNAENGRTICVFNTNTTNEVQFIASAPTKTEGTNTVYAGYAGCMIYSSDTNTWYNSTSN